MSAIRLFLFSCSLLGACDDRGQGEASSVASVKLGVFFGGQIQEREAIPLVFDRSKQEYGFRIRFAEAVTQPLRLRWEVEMPAPKSAEPERLTKLSEGMVASGRREIDQVLPMRAGDPLGIYNYRIVVGDELILDRTLWIVEPDER